MAGIGGMGGGYFYAAASGLTRERKQRRGTTPRKIAQKVLREWCRANGVVLEAFIAADLVNRIETEVLAISPIQE